MTQDIEVESPSFGSYGVELTPEQAAQRKTPRPKYYSASMGAQVTISPAFEDFLILLPRAVKSSIAAWINGLSKEIIPDTELAEVLTDFLDAQLYSLSESMCMVDVLLLDLDSFQAQFNLTGFDAVAEKQLISEDVSYGIEDLVAMRDDLKYMESMIKVVDHRRLSGILDPRVDSERASQMDSWVTVISQYLS